MSHLEALKERLKRKPEVRPNEGVRVVIAPQIKEDIKNVERILTLISRLYSIKKLYHYQYSINLL